MGAFGEWQEAYASRSIATFPVRIGSDGDKKPAIRRWQNVGLVASKVLGERFAGSDAFGFCAGKKSGLAVLDIDTPDEKALADALARHGETPLVVRTGSGHWQGWYRWNGEGRKIRPRRGEPVDILGSGLVVAPPSIASRRRYELVAGSLDDLKNLPAMRVGGDHLLHTGGEAATKGTRNQTLFKFCLRAARSVESLGELIDVARAKAATYLPAMEDEGEIARTAGSAWRYTVEGKNWSVAHVVSATHEEIDALAAKNPDALSLLLYLRRHNWGRTFPIAARAMAASFGWTLPRFKRARDLLIALSEVVCVHPGGRGAGDPPIFIFPKGVSSD